MKALAKAWKMNEPQSYFTFASGILGFGLPAAVALHLLRKIRLMFRNDLVDREDPQRCCGQ